MSGNPTKRFGIFKVIAIVIVLLVVVIAALPFVLDVNQFRPKLESMLSKALEREVKTGNLKLSIFSGSVSVDDITIAENPDFAGSDFVTAKSLNVGIELKPLIFDKEFRITGITLDRPTITLVRSSSGKWNFSDLGSKAEAGKGSPGAGADKLSAADIMVRRLKINNGRVTVIEGAGEPFIYDDVDVIVENLSLSSTFPFSLSGSLPGGGNLKLEGKAGPLNTADTLLTPVTADLAVTHFDLVASGFVAADSGIGGVFDFNSKLTSDGREARNEGQASVEKLQLVKGGSPAGRPVSLAYSINYDLAKQKGTLSNATITCNKAVARLKGNYEMRGNDLVLKLKLLGDNMPVQDLTAMLPAFGVTLPKGASLQGGVLNTELTAEGPIEKMVTTGFADISRTRLVGFDLAGKMATVARLAGIKSNQETEIEKFASGMRLTPQGIYVNDLLLKMPALGELSGSGNIASDQSLDFKMRALLKPSSGVGGKLMQLAGGRSLNVPFFVRGTASEPKFIPDAKGAAQGLLGSALSGQSSEEGQSKTDDVLGNAIRGLLKKKK